MHARQNASFVVSELYKLNTSIYRNQSISNWIIISTIRGGKFPTIGASNDIILGAPRALLHLAQICSLLRAWIPQNEIPRYFMHTLILTKP